MIRSFATIILLAVAGPLISLYIRDCEMLASLSAGTCSCAKSKSLVDDWRAPHCQGCASGHRMRKTGRCAQCGAGTFAPRNSLTCLACAPGYTSDDGAEKCTRAGTYASSGLCKACKAGTYSAPGKQKCTSCPKGHFSDKGAVRCSTCPVGSYSPVEGSSVCRLATTGSIVDTVGASQATACQAGSFASEVGATACAACAPGTHAPSEGRAACAVCRAGTASAAGAKECAICPSGTFSKSNFGACKWCASNHYSRAAADSCAYCGDFHVSSPGSGACTRKSAYGIASAASSRLSTALTDSASFVAGAFAGGFAEFDASWSEWYAGEPPAEVSVSRAMCLGSLEAAREHVGTTAAFQDFTQAVSPANASYTACKKATRSLSLLLHPDKYTLSWDCEQWGERFDAAVAVAKAEALFDWMQKHTSTACDRERIERMRGAGFAGKADMSDWDDI